MGDFRRTRSKVWFPTYFEEDEDEAEDKDVTRSSSNGVAAVSNWRRSGGSIGLSSSDRGSSGSPSTGSQRSQDSGFSDSESSPAGGKSDGSDSKIASLDSNRRSSPILEMLEESSPSKLMESLGGLPESPVKMSKCGLVREKNRRKRDKYELVKWKSNSIGNYLADCYFPVCQQLSRSASNLNKDFINPRSVDNLEKYSDLVTKMSSSSCSYSHDKSRSQSRTCFIVDELPKIPENCNAENFASNNPCGNEDLSVSCSSLLVMYENQPRLGVAEQLNQSQSSVDSCAFNQLVHTSTPTKQIAKPHQGIYTRCSAQCNTFISSKSYDLPVVYWLKELRDKYEPECTITLQSKPINSALAATRRMTDIIITVEYVKIFYARAKMISEEFSQLYRKINRLAFEQICPLLQSLINHVMEFLVNYAMLLTKSNFNVNEDLIVIMDLCDRLRLTVRYPSFGEVLLDEIDGMGQAFTHYVNNLLIIQVKILLSMLDSSCSEYKILNTLHTITSLAAVLSYIGELFSYYDAIDTILNICVKSHNSDVRKAALRALATICCRADSVRRLEKAGGIEILSNILSDLTRSENELLEAVSVLVQITAPWMDDNKCVRGLTNHLYTIINSLTCVITTTSLNETLLLAAAALANISFLEPKAVWILLEVGTMGCLLTAVRRQGGQVSVFLQEQTVTLIANMAAIPETRSHLAEHRAVAALLCFLQVRHSPLQTPAEINAAERLQHKSAIALSRLCSDVEICRQVVELNGVKWLVHLCKEERERNYRDDVLVACLAALRKIAKNCGKSVVEELNGKELIEPRFVDSYLLYSSRQESYV